MSIDGRAQRTVIKKNCINLKKNFNYQLQNFLSKNHRLEGLTKVVNAPYKNDGLLIGNFEKNP